MEKYLYQDTRCKLCATADMCSEVVHVRVFVACTSYCREDKALVL